MRASKPSINTIVSDIGGVLCGSSNPGANKRLAAAHYGVSLEDLSAAMKVNRGLIYLANSDEAAYWNAVADALGIAPEKRPEAKLFFTADSVEHSFRYDKIYDALMQLRNRYQLIALSNTMPAHIARARERGVYDSFHQTIFSCDPDVNLMKPDERLFQLALDRARCEPGQILYIDDIAEFLTPARRFGMNAHQVRSCDEFFHSLTDNGIFVK